ncbi:hypothetical protein N752_00585 [Desulforamulus aquiferis]|nr:hypothetical protein N752_00585 [Desulforamulus aquiferis]
MRRSSLALWGRLTVVLAAVVFAIVMLIGGTLASNYKGLGNLIKVVTL